MGILESSLASEQVGMFEASMKASRDFLAGRQDLQDVDIYNTWRLLLTKDEIDVAVRYCAKVINEKFKGKDIVIACILKGCVYFFVDLTRMITLPHSCYMFEFSSYVGQTQNSGEILSLIQPEKFKNKYVILLDELYDNGLTLESVKQEIMKKGNVPSENIFTCTLMRKEHSGKYPEPDLCPLVLPDCWCTGLGLDDSQQKRNWNCVYACPKAPGIELSEADKMFMDNDVYVKEREKIIAQIKKLVDY